jgi:GntR family colanic acid and biofilm gene transcriptional regulator
VISTTNSSALVGHESERVDLAPYMAVVAETSEGDDDALNVQAYRVLREALLSGAFAPGTHLNIRPIAAQLGMSPMPVREALARLRSDGALETLPNRAFRVPILAVATFREILLTRIRLEQLACERAATRIDFGDLKRIAALYEVMVQEEGGRPEDYLRLHRQFHFAIYDVAAMPVLTGVIEGLWLRIGPLIYASSRERMAVDRNHHAAILGALRASDPVAAAAALRDDIADGLEPICDYLVERGSQTAP